MIIPFHDKTKLHEKLIWIRDACCHSVEDRRAMYTRRRRFWLFGTYGGEKVLYNRLMAHIDLVASFLYAADHCRYNISPPRNADASVRAMVQALGKEWNDDFHDSGLSQQFAQGLIWSLNYDAMFLKVGWNDSRDELYGKLVSPANFAVFDESEPDLDAQEAFVHTYRLHWDNAVLRLIRAGLADKIQDLRTEVGSTTDDMPAVMAQMIISNTGGSNLAGAMMGQAMPDFEPTGTYEPKSDVPTVQFQEVWVWDDAAEDYRIFTIADPDIIISDSRDTVAAIAKADAPELAVAYKSETNIFLPEEHPFVVIRPYEMFDYFWGEAHSERLIPLQKWTNERLDQIHEILEMQVDPAKVFSGFMGLSDEKAGALGGPGTWVIDQLPNAQVKELKPEMPPDLFAELKEIGQIFLEASGLTETVAGKGEAGVRGGKHAKQLSTTGSGRIKKTAVGLESALVRLGDLGIKLKMRNQDEAIQPDPPGPEFVPSQMPVGWNCRVDGHSHSPLFADDSQAMAQALLKANAIDREMFVRLLHAPNEDNIISALRERVKKEEAIKAANPSAGNAAGKKTQKEA